MCLRKGLYPCGVCPECVEKRRFEWSLRAQSESEASLYCFFGMMTFSDDNLFYAIDENTGEMSPTLNYKAVQLCMKRFRRNFGFIKTAYLVSGEYGKTTHRPHYHPLILIKSLSFTNDAQLRQLSFLTSFRGRFKYFRRLSQQMLYWHLFSLSPRYFCERFLESVWKLGFVSLSVPKKGVRATVHYATKYMYGKCNPPNDFVETHFILASKGIGKSMVDKLPRSTCSLRYHSEPFSYDVFNQYYNTKQFTVAYDGYMDSDVPTRMMYNGFKISIPRYVREKYAQKYFNDIQLEALHECGRQKFEYYRYRGIYDYVKNFHIAVVDDDVLQRYDDFLSRKFYNKVKQINNRKKIKKRYE